MEQQRKRRLAMTEQLRNWHPNRHEVAEILRELRPIIARMAARDAVVLAGLDRASLAPPAARGGQPTR
jgi:hypothetical protein